MLRFTVCLGSPEVCIRSTAVLRSLFCSLVWQFVEYDSPIWSHYTLGERARLKALQQRFIHLVGVKLGYGFLEVFLEDLTEALHLPFLSPRQDVADIVLLWKMINGFLNCFDLMAEIKFRVPSITRSQECLSRRYHSTSYDYNSPLTRFVRLGNCVAAGSDRDRVQASSSYSLQLSLLLAIV